MPYCATCSFKRFDREHEAAGRYSEPTLRFFANSLQVVVDGLAGMIRQLKLDAVGVQQITVGGNILDLDSYDVAAPKLAIDGEVSAISSLSGGKRTLP